MRRTRQRRKRHREHPGPQSGPPYTIRISEAISGNVKAYRLSSVLAAICDSASIINDL